MQGFINSLLKIPQAPVNNTAVPFANANTAVPNSPIIPATPAGTPAAPAGTPAAPAPSGLSGIIGRAGDYLASPQGKSLFAALGQIGSAIAPPGSFQERLGTVGANLNTSDLFANALSQPGSVDFNKIFANMFKGNGNTSVADALAPK